MISRLKSISNELAGVEKILRIDRLLDQGVEFAEFRSRGGVPPAFLGKADAVLAGDRSAPSDDLREERVEDPLDLLGTLGLLFLGDHDIHMDVSIPGVTEAGDREAGLFLQFLREGDEVDESAARDGDILVELGEAGGLQRCREGAAQGPHPVATLG